jgi:7-keto-8-aminopelargonate synthetase-like enzyme
MLPELQLELERLSVCEALPPYTSRSHGKIEVGGRVVHDFANWDVLSLNETPRFRISIQHAIEEYGFSVSASRMNGGLSPVHSRVEKRLAKGFGFSTSLLFPSRTQAVFSLLAALLREGDVVFVEESSSAPVGDVSYLCHSELISFSRSRLESLEAELKKLPPSVRKLCFIEANSPLSDSTLEMSALMEICQRFEVVTIIDETFALGHMGERGYGYTDFYHLSAQPIAVVGSLGTGLGLTGGFVATSSTLGELILARSQFLRNEPQPSVAVVAGLHVALEIIEVSLSHRLRIQSLTKGVVSRLTSSGVKCFLDPGSCSFNLSIGSAKRCIEAQKVLLEQGILAGGYFGHRGKISASSLCFTVNSCHTEAVAELLSKVVVDISQHIANP